MFGYIGAYLVRTYWRRLGKPFTPRIAGNIEDTCNIWLNGMKGGTFLLGARVEVREDENPPEALSAGIINAWIFAAPPGSLKEIGFALAYDLSYVMQAFAA
jgi:hypothetical protein